MCLVLIAIDQDEQLPVVIAANRDEYYERPTATAHFWQDAPEVLAGRDLRGQGTWLGVTRNGRIAAVTNYRDPSNVIQGAPSRGGLVSGFLLEKTSPAGYVEKLSRQAGAYNGFNLIAGMKNEIYWYSNRARCPLRLDKGIYGLSNHLLDTPWPKVRLIKKEFRKILASGKGQLEESLFQILQDRYTPEDGELPSTGVKLEWERILSPIFIKSPSYGTRSSTVITIDRSSMVRFEERSYGPGIEDHSGVRFSFGIS